MPKQAAMPIARLAPGRGQRIAEGHPWVYANEVARVEGAPQPGAIVEVRDSRNMPLGRGYINPRSQILVRLLTQCAEPVDAGLIRRRIGRAWEYRQAVLDDTSSCRVIF